MPLTHEVAEQAEREYRKQTDRFEKLGREVASICEDVVSSLHVPATVRYRTKHPRSFRAKLDRFIKTKNRAKIRAVDSAEDALNLVGDLAGVRVITYIDADRERVVAKLESVFAGPAGSKAPIIEVMNKEGGYRATHCQVCLPERVISGSSYLENVDGTSVEIQVCSILAHVWNEIEHDIRYKEMDAWGTDATMRDALLDDLRQAATHGDAIIGQLLHLRSQRAAMGLAKEVAARLSGYGDLGDRQIVNLAVAIRFGYDSADSIVRFVESNVTPAQEFAAAFNAWAGEDPDLAELRFDDSAGDVLLAALVLEHARAIAAIGSQGDPGREANIAIFAIQAGLVGAQ